MQAVTSPFVMKEYDSITAGVGISSAVASFSQGAIRVSPITGAVGHAGSVAEALCDGDATQVCPLP